MEAIIITANLGRMKAYRVVETPTRGRKLDLVEDLEFLDAHGRTSEKLSDQAGRFPMTEAAGPPRTTQLSTYEAHTLGTEIERRLIRLVAQAMTATLERERSEIWYFAASPEVHDAILEEITTPGLRERRLRSARVDLVKTPPQEVLAHFGPL